MSIGKTTIESNPFWQKGRCLVRCGSIRKKSIGRILPAQFSLGWRVLPLYKENAKGEAQSFQVLLFKDLSNNFFADVERHWLSSALRIDNTISSFAGFLLSASSRVQEVTDARRTVFSNARLLLLNKTY